MYVANGFDELTPLLIGVPGAFRGSSLAPDGAGVAPHAPALRPWPGGTRRARAGLYIMILP